MRFSSLFVLLVAMVASNADSVLAGGFKGGGRVGGGIPRAASPPASMPHMGGGAMSRPTMPAARPSIARPSVSRPNVGGGISGGMKPSLSTNGNRPATRPSSALGSSPTKLPGEFPGAPNAFPATRPSTKPSIPSLGGSGFERPSKLPEASNRPGFNQAGTNRPGINQPGTNRPSVLPERRPSPNDVGDFLGISDGLKPADRLGVNNRPSEMPGTRPGDLASNLSNSPNRPTTLPGQTKPNVNLPGSNRPVPLPARPIDLPVGTPGRPGLNPRPINIDNINVGNTVINRRPSWVNIENDRVASINKNWQTQVNGLQRWASAKPARIEFWNGWGNKVRVNWHSFNNHNRWFAGDWWYSHPGGVCRWHYYHQFNNYPWHYWWRRPTWTVTSSWFTWSAPANVWSQPIYYDYGTGGNLTYQDNSVYIGSQPIASANEFAESAAALATVEPPALEAESAEWLPLGTFALSTSESDTDPTRVVQLAVDKSGIVAGTLYNRETDQVDAIQGHVDKETQRVAIRIAESDSIVAETGIYNLTQDQVPLLVHFGTDRVENYILVRLEQSEEANANNADQTGK